MNGKKLWQELLSHREPVLMRARDCAALTIPSVLPPLGHDDSRDLPQPYQSLGARGVNNLSSRLLMALFPAGSPFFRQTVDDEVAEAGGQGFAEVQKRLARMETKAMQRFEGSSIRPALAETLTQLVVTGNVLAYFGDLDDFRFYRLDQFCIRRDAAGNPVRAVVEEKVHPSTLDEETRAACGLSADSQKDVEIYTVIEWKDGRVRYRQEINDKIVPLSESDVPADKSPWMPLRWKAVPGAHYGRGMVEEYLGDLRSLEGLSQAVVEFAAIAAKVVWLVHPNATTDMEDINNAESGEAVTGQKADVDALQLDKYADFQVVAATAERLETRLSYAFLLRSGSTRDAERVTAEEIRAVAQELEDVLGGVYTVLAQELQLPFVRRLLSILTRSGDLPALPKGTVTPVIVTGFQALGRNHSLNRLRGLIGDLVSLLGPEGALETLRASEITKRLAVGWGVEALDSLIRSEEEIQQNRQAQQQQAQAGEMAKAAAGPAAAAMMKQG